MDTLLGKHLTCLSNSALFWIFWKIMIYYMKLNFSITNCLYYDLRDECRKNLQHETSLNKTFSAHNIIIIIRVIQFLLSSPPGLLTKSIFSVIDMMILWLLVWKLVQKIHWDTFLGTFHYYLPAKICENRGKWKNLI